MAYDCTLIETYSGFGPELTTDGNMEDDPATNWPGTDAVVSRDIVVYRNGCQAINVVPNLAAPGSATQDITVEAGHRYRIGVWGLCNAATDQWRVTIYIAGSVVWTSDWHANDTDWEEEVKFYRVPNTITTIEIRLEVDQIGDICYFDDVSVKREGPVEMNEIDLLFRATDDWALLDQGISINDPAIKEIWGGELEDKLVHRSEGKRVIPMELNLEAGSADELIDDVNGLEEMLRHAARYRKDDWGGEVFLQFKTDNATHYVWYPVLAGRIDKRNLMKICNSDEEIDSVPATIICEAYWESPFTYDLFNVLDNPGFEEWNDGICNSEPDCWVDYSTAGASGENQQETDTVEEGCEALRITMAVGVAAGAYQGVDQDITARLRADTEYTLLAWVQNTDVFVNCVAQVYAEGQNSGITYALNSGAANADYTIYDCQFTPNATDIANWVEIRLRILTTDVNATGLIHIDKVLVMEASNVPTGWMSSSYLTNHYDRDANTVNFLSVCDIPGEVEAESRYLIDIDDSTAYLRVARRTRNNPCNFIWQLIPCEGYTTAEGGAGGACTPGLIDGVTCIDSDKIIDATSPSGSRINVTFAGDQTMRRRCYWDIGLTPLDRELMSYYGKFQLLLVAKMAGGTDDATIRVLASDSPNTLGYVAERDVSGVAWTLYDGWETLAYRIGTVDNDLFGAGNSLRILIYAETDGTPTDDLHIAGAFLVPIDESFILGGSFQFASTVDFILKNMDGEAGLFAYASATDVYYPNLGAIGTYPLLTPEVENWLYFVLTGSLESYGLDDTFNVGLKYRPRGIFLRGTNP